MKRLAFAFVICSTFLVSGCADYSKKIVGTWVLQDDKLPTEWEFSPDGKLKMSLVLQGSSIALGEGTYKVDGKNLSITAKLGTEDKSDSGTIKELTDDKMVLAGKEKDLVFTKKK